MNIININTITRRTHWVEKIRQLCGNFGDNSEQLEKEIHDEIKEQGTSALIDHLRLCGNIPESYSHDSSEEKLYSKYTDSLLAKTFTAVGLKSLVLKGRGDTADVEVFAESYSFVADAFSYWLVVNKTMLEFSIKVDRLWKTEKQAAVESIAIAKEEALAILAREREKIMRMTHKEALLELVRVHNIENRIKTIQSVSDNGLLEIR